MIFGGGMRWSGAFGLTVAAGVFLDDLAAELDALVADVDRAGAGDQPLDLVLVLAAEGAVVLTRVPLPFAGIA